MNKLEVKNIGVSYDGKEIIKDISINVKSKEIVSLIGLSGVGKTTIFNVIAGLNTPNTGNVYLNSEDITSKSGNVSYMLQKDLLLPFKTVIENIALPLIIKGIKKETAFEEVKKYIKVFGLEGTEDKYPKALSGGMRQRAALLRTYMFSNEVALLDEPFSALDSITKSEMQDWYLGIMKEINLSTLFITHDIEEAILLSDRVYILAGKPGKIVKEITINLKKPRDILSLECIELKKTILKILKEKK